MKFVEYIPIMFINMHTKADSVNFITSLKYWFKKLN